MNVKEADWLTFTVYGLATWRLSELFSSDVGPWGMFSKLRSFLKREAKHNKPLRESKVHLGVSCMKCESIWMATPIAAFVFLAVLSAAVGSHWLRGVLSDAGTVCDGYSD